jgi:hypothetical protein
MVQSVHNGRLLATRASRRQRAQVALEPRPAGVTVAPAFRWRLRVVDEPPLPGDEVLHLRGTAAAERTSVLASIGRSLGQVSGPPISSSLLDVVTRQLLPTGLGRRLWGLAPARVGPSVDLVADGSALRVHAEASRGIEPTQDTRQVKQEMPRRHAADRSLWALAVVARCRPARWLVPPGRSPDDRQ